ncbi:MAG: ATP-dependent DNA ligase [Rhodomicrobium sp.]
MPREPSSLRSSDALVRSGAFPVDPATPPMEARQVERLPPEPGWQYEPKWDGFRCLLFRAGKRAVLAGKSGKSLARFFPEIVSLIERLSPDGFALDGELVVTGDGASSFDALQMRLHPAESRIKRLSQETPATVILFDALAVDGRTLLTMPLMDRREALEAFYRGQAGEPLLRLSPFTRDEAVAREWLNASGGAIDGVVAKRLDGVYEPGKRAMMKVKRLRTADCVVGGFRYLERERLVGSLLLGLYNERGELDHVGFTSAIAAEDRAELTKRLEELIEPPGFTGKAPGGPSRWATEKSSAWEPVRPVLVVEVQYDHITANRFRHGTKLIRWRPDKSPRQCTFDQLPVRGSPRLSALLTD